MEKTVQTRIINKHDTATNWNNNSSFVPKKGEIIIYDRDDVALANPKIKIGNGSSTIKDLPFAVEKTSWEYNREFSASSNGKVCIGKFPMYDTNVTIQISTTTSSTYSGTLVIATQNINNSHGGNAKVVVYGDPTGTLSQALTVIYPQTSRIFEVYGAFSGWSKNIVHIQAVGLQGAATNILDSVTSIPTENSLTVTNLLTSTFAKQTDVPGLNNKELNMQYLSSSTDVEIVLDGGSSTELV